MGVTAEAGHKTVIFCNIPRCKSVVVMKKVAQPGRLGDLFHKGWVLTCVGVTVLGMSYVGMATYEYFQLKEARRLALEKDKEMYTVSDSVPELKDTAPVLKS